MDEKNEKKKVAVQELFKELAGTIAELYVAIYEKQDNSLIMRLLNGQKFKITVEEMV